MFVKPHRGEIIESTHQLPILCPYGDTAWKVEEKQGRDVIITLSSKEQVDRFLGE